MSGVEEPALLTTNAKKFAKESATLSSDISLGQKLGS